MLALEDPQADEQAHEHGAGRVARYLLFSVFGRPLLFVLEKVKPKMWFGFRPRNLDRNFCTRAILAKEWIHRPEENGFPAAHHLRQSGLEPGMTVEVNLLSVKAVVSQQVHPRARHLKHEVRETKD